MKKYINISDVLWFQEGPGVRNTQYTTDGVKLLNVTNLINGNVDTTNTNRYISKEEAYGKYKHFLADEGDLVIASSGIKVEYFDKKMGFIRKEQLPLCMNTSTIRFKVTDEKRLSIRYFMYYLKSNHFKEQLGQQITGSAQLNFGPSHLKKMVFPLIEMEEQAKIIDKLDTIYGIEYKMRTELKLYDQLVRSLFIEMFGDLFTNPMNWNKQPLGAICNKVIRYPTFYGMEYLETGIKVIRIGNILSDGRMDLDDKKYVFIDDIVNKDFPETIIEMNDIIMAVRGDGSAAKRIGIIREPQLVGANISPNLIRIKVDCNKLNPIYMFYYLTGEVGQKYLDVYVNKTAKKNIAAKDIVKVSIYVPPLDLQNRFAEYVSSIDKSKLAVKKSLEELEILKKSLMQKYFA